MRFEITINGEKLCTAGIEGYGVLSTTITRVKRNPGQVDSAKLRNMSFEETLREVAEINVTGLDTNDSAGGRGKHVGWLVGELEVGDEIVVRVLPPGESDIPKDA